MGTPASTAHRGDEFQRNAKLTFQMWQNQGQLFTPQAQPSVNIPIPQLLSRSIPEPPLVPTPPGSAKLPCRRRLQSHLCSKALSLESKSTPAGTMDRRSAEHALQLAREAAHRAVTCAAYLAGAAGLDYTAPAGFPVDLTNVPKRDVRALEVRVRAAEQALAARHSQGLDRIQSMGVLPSLASVPELQERRHSLPAGANSTMRSGPPPQQRPEQQRSRPDDSAAADIDSMSDSPRATHKTQRGQNRAADPSPAMSGAVSGQRPRIRSNALPRQGAPSQQAKAKQKAGPKQAAQEGGDAWAAAPDKLLRLRVKDVRNTLKERWLQLFWPEDGRWWPGQVLDIRCKERKIHLMYKTGEEETDLDLGDLIKKGEVAWLSTQEMMKASEAAQNGARESSLHQDALRDREAPAESPRQRKRPLDSSQQAGVGTPLRHPSLSPPFSPVSAANTALHLEAYDDDDLDPFEHWEQVQEQQRQRQLQQGPDTAASLLPL